MTLLQTAIDKYDRALREAGRSNMTGAEIKSFEAGWSACVVEYRKAEDEEYEEEAAESKTGCRIDL